MKILENLWQVGGAEFTSVEDAAVYLVCFGRSAFLVDSGCGSDHRSLVDNISEVLPQKARITHLFLTHCHYDHTGGAQKTRHQYGCQIVAHELDAVYLEKGDSEVTAAAWYGAHMHPLKIDYKITNREEAFPIDKGLLTAYHCPGHSPGSVAYLVELNSLRVLFGQDVHGPLDDALLSNRDAYIRSLKFMLSLEADILCEGHYGIYRGKDEVKKFIGSFLDG